MLLCKGSSEINSGSDWFKLAPPKKGALQWKDGRSAKELAKAWCEGKNRPSPPEEFLRLLTPLVNTEQLAGAVGWPENQVPIDDLPGEPPNIDLAIVSEGLLGSTAICVEAKADESFGKYALAVHDDAAKKIEQGMNTNAIIRLLHLEATLFTESDASLPGRGEILRCPGCPPSPAFPWRLERRGAARPSSRPYRPAKRARLTEPDCCRFYQRYL
jgi:hypothetical protein